MNEREHALYILTDILNDKAYNNIILRKALKQNNQLSKIQKAFITELVNGTLRNIILIDYIINQFSSVKTKKMKPFIINLIRISVYQIMFMNKVPVSAACNEAVNLAKKKGFKNLSGFVNGVLRNISRNIENLKYPDEENEKVKFLSIMYSYPEWIINYWLEEFDYNTVKEICITNNKAPKISICINSLRTDKKELKQILTKDDITVTNGLFDGLVISKTSDISNLTAYKKGLFHVMDESSMLAVNILNPKENDVIIDVCAAPGGKSFKCAYMTNNISNIISRDIHEHKVELMNEGAKRLGIQNINTQLNNAEIHYKDDEEKADCLIIDAPCSGLGLVRKKPDIKYNKTISDIDELVKIQRNIIDACWNYVKVGGTLVYSTCTISKKENIDNVKWIMKNYPFEQVDISEFVKDNFKSQTAKNGFIQVLPNMLDTDGFFIAKFKRKG